MTEAANMYYEGDADFSLPGLGDMDFAPGEMLGDTVQGWRILLGEFSSSKGKNIEVKQICYTGTDGHSTASGLDDVEDQCSRHHRTTALAFCILMTP